MIKVRNKPPFSSRHNTMPPRVLAIFFLYFASNACEGKSFSVSSGTQAFAIHPVLSRPLSEARISQKVALSNILQAAPSQALSCRLTSRRQRVQRVTMMAKGGKKGVLFVCLGNICRSPTAEAVFNSVVQNAGVADSFNIDSCGTGGGSPNWYKKGGFSYHEGESADSRMKEVFGQVAARRGVNLTSASRPLKPGDFEEFDAIIYMDDSNKMQIYEAANHWGVSQEVVKDKVKSMMSFSRTSPMKYVPDPYYGDADGFEKVLDLLDEACDGLLEHLQENKN